MNHRSNADYVLVGYVLSGQVAISYAVGEWARTFPLEYIFKSFGAYFIRRKYREKLYHTVLERYVQLITRNGVTQGIFLEGGLSRDGRLGKREDRSARLRARRRARSGECASALYIVPVAINYDRVLEDRSLLRELDAREGRQRPPRYVQLGEVVRYVWWNMARLVARRWKRYGRAAVVIGDPFPLAPWLDQQDSETRWLLLCRRAERLALVQGFADSVLERIAAMIPVTAGVIGVRCDAELRRRFHITRAAAGQDVGNARRAARAQCARDSSRRKHRRMCSIVRGGCSNAAHARESRVTDTQCFPAIGALVSYYANSVAHLLGPFAAGVRERDQLPMLVAGL